MLCYYFELLFICVGLGFVGFMFRFVTLGWKCGDCGFRLYWVLFLFYGLAFRFGV